MENRATALDKAGRNTRIEALRILSMLLIVAFHATGMGFPEPERAAVVQVSHMALGSWGILGVDIFLIVSAYFLTEQPFKSRRAVGLVFQVFCYVALSAVLTAGYWALTGKSVLRALKALAQSHFDSFWDPLWSNRYWFVTAYLFMVAASPFLNRLLERADKRTLKKALVVFAAVPVYAQFHGGAVTDFAVFCYVYLLVGAVKKYRPARILRFAKPLWAISLLAAALCGKLLLLLPGLPANAATVITQTVGASHRHAVILLAAALSVCFYVFDKAPVCRRAVNRAAAHTLGVYLLAEVSVLGCYSVQGYIFKKLEWIGFLAEDAAYPLRFLAASAAVVALGIAVEAVRSAVLQKPFMRLTQRFFGKKLDRLDGWFNGTAAR